MVEIKITYETLFDLLRREKSRSELQQLEASFYQDVVAYLKEKKGTLRTEDHTLLFSRTEQEKIKIQIRNIQKILRELYEIREKKVFNLALNKVRTESNLINTSALLPEEMNFFHDACDLLSRYKIGVLHKILSMEFPVIEEGSLSNENYHSEQNAAEQRAPNEEREQDRGQVTSSKESIFDFKSSNFSSTTDHASKVKEDEGKIKVRILNDLPKFMGQDKSIYGPFAKNDEVYLPQDITNILLKKGRVEVL